MNDLFDSAVRSYQSGDLANAETLCRRAIDADPRHAGAHHLLGLITHQTDRNDVAVGLLQEAVTLAPADPGCRFNLAVVLATLGQTAQAIACYRHVVALDPTFADAYTNLGNLLQGQGDLAEATRCYRQAVTLDPALAKAHINLGQALTRLAQFDAADAHYEQALRILPESQTARLNRALLRLLGGDLSAGWPDYERRWPLPGVSPRDFQQPRWDGAPLRAKTILVYAEQGLGDTIQFVRYLPLVKARGGTVIFECQAPLVKLCQGTAGADRVVAAPATSGDLAAVDVQIPLLSLPGAFGTTLSTIPAAVPYVHADPVLVEKWNSELARIEGFKIGVAWQGNPNHPEDRYRSMPLTHFESLTRLEGVRLISLQKGAATAQQCGFPLIDFAERLDAAGPFLDTAAIMKSLDLVIATDSAVAHLAGALGVPTWILLNIAPDWRWLLDRDDSPWYPTVRLFRQKRFGDWAEVMERLAHAVRSASIDNGPRRGTF